MSKRQRRTTAATTKNRLEQGRGQGTGINYNPWLHIQDVASPGLAQRIRGWTTGREHHLMDQLEARYFYELEWSPKVIDIREHFPLLPVWETREIAERCGVNHPTDRHTGEPVVMTTDFLVTKAGSRHPVEQARAVMYQSSLTHPQTAHLLEIERRYWIRRRVDWGIVTELELPEVRGNNLAVLHRYVQIDDRVDLTPELLQQIIAWLTSCVVADHSTPLRDIAARCDTRFDLLKGIALTVIYHLVAKGHWQIDLNIPLDPARPLSLTAILERTNGTIC